MVEDSKEGARLRFQRGIFPSGYFLYAPDAAYVTAEQLVGVTSKQLARFPRLCPAFIIELVSLSDRRAAVEAKMQEWIANGTLVAWLIDPYKKTVTIYEPDKAPQTLKTERVSGTGSIDGFELSTTDIGVAMNSNQPS